MLRRGEWRATAAGDGETVGYHLSALYSPVGWSSWVEIAQRWTAAQGDPTLLKVFVNTILGETWQERGDAPDWDAVYARRDGYRSGSVPRGVLVLFAGCDVQKDRIEVSIWGFGRRRERWLIEHRTLVGATNRPEVWSELAGMFEETWQHEDGAELAVRDWGIDSGAFAPEVSAFVRLQRGRGNVHAIDGLDRDHSAFIRIGKMDVTIKGKKLKGGLKTLGIGVSYCKQELVGQLALEKSDDEYPVGFVHLPGDVSQETVKQLTAESLVTRTVRGRVKREWRIMEGRRNEALDCANYARGLADWRRGLPRPFERAHNSKRHRARAHSAILPKCSTDDMTAAALDIWSDTPAPVHLPSSRPAPVAAYMRGEQLPLFFRWNPALRVASDDVRACVYRKPNPDIVVMKPAEDCV
jgi:phage terminase large subunit GpA-like protein